MTTRTALLELRAVDLMQRDLITVNVDDPMREIERVLVDAQVSAVPVLDDSGALLGVVSMRDVVSRYADEDDPCKSDASDSDDEDWRPVGQLCAGDMMATDMLRVGPNTSLGAMARVMVANATHRVLVVENDRLLGLVSTMDVLRAIAEQPDED